MIGRLRKKFIIINMSLVAAVLLTVFTAMALSVLRQTNRSVDEALAAALNRRMDDMPIGPEIGKRIKDNNRRAQSTPTLPIFCVQLDETGAVAGFMLQNVTVSAAVMADAAAQAVAGGENPGTLREYDLRYAIRYSSAGAKIAFVDLSGVHADVTRQLIMLLIAGVAGLAAFFCISVALSAWALRPVERAWERQRQFVADASHELKTPLTVVLANTDIVLAHPQETVADQARWLTSTKTESLRMKALVDDMLFLARADLAVPPAMEPFSLSDAVWSAALPFEAVAFEAGVRLNTDIAEGINLYGNRQQLEQLTAILLDNAIQYAEKGSAVTACLTADTDGVRLRVNNAGEPIAPDKLPHLFERFYRTEAARERSAGGYGLGLAIAKSIAQMHRANIVVTSNGVSGTTFCVEWREHRALAG